MLWTSFTPPSSFSSLSSYTPSPSCRFLTSSCHFDEYSLSSTGHVVLRLRYHQMTCSFLPPRLVMWLLFRLKIVLEGCPLFHPASFSLVNFCTRDVPLNPKLIKIRTDIVWEEVVLNFHKERKLLNGIVIYLTRVTRGWRFPVFFLSLNSIFFFLLLITESSHKVEGITTHPNWSIPFARSYLEKIARSRKMNPLLPDTYYRLHGFLIQSSVYPYLSLSPPSSPLPGIALSPILLLFLLWLIFIIEREILFAQVQGRLHSYFATSLSRSWVRP